MSDGVVKSSQSVRLVLVQADLGVQGRFLNGALLFSSSQDELQTFFRLPTPRCICWTFSLVVTSFGLSSTLAHIYIRISTTNGKTQKIFVATRR